MKRNMAELYEKAKAISRKTNINVLIGSAPTTAIDLELYSPQLKTCDYPVLLMRQLKPRKIKEGTMERFVFKKGGLL